MSRYTQFSVVRAVVVGVGLATVVAGLTQTDAWAGVPIRQRVLKVQPHVDVLLRKKHIETHPMAGEGDRYRISLASTSSDVHQLNVIHMLPGARAGTRIGHATATSESFNGRRAWVLEQSVDGKLAIEVAKQHQGKGLGRATLSLLMQLAKQSRQDLFVVRKPIHDNVLSWYQSLGFRPVKELGLNPVNDTVVELAFPLTRALRPQNASGFPSISVGYKSAKTSRRRGGFNLFSRKKRRQTADRHVQRTLPGFPSY